MKRRSLLALLLAAGGARGAQAAPSSALAVAWGGPAAPAVFVLGADGHVEKLDTTAAAGLAPMPTRRGIWIATPTHALERWAPDDSGHWQAAERHWLDEPLLACTATEDGLHAVAAHGSSLSVVQSGRGVVRVLDGRSLDGRRQGVATALFALPQRRSVVAAWPAMSEWWEISLDPQAAPIHDGLVHDYRMGEAIARPGYLNPRRTPLEAPVPAMDWADGRVPWLAGTQPGGVAIVHLDVRRVIARLPFPDAQPAQAVLMGTAGAWRWWLPAGERVLVFDAARWVVLDELPLPGRVRGLQAVGEVVWALVEAAMPGAPTLYRHGTDGWRALAGWKGEVHGVWAEPGGSRAWLATKATQGDGAALQLVDAQGQALRHWPLPTAVQGAAWLR